MKCDLHVHSYYSGTVESKFLNFCRESYSDPEELYQQLRRRGMDLMTVTDHDSIDGAALLAHHSDFFISEELTCTMPSGTTVHIGAYDLTERQHLELQRRRNDLLALLVYLSERRIFFSINHIFSGLTGPRDAEDFVWFEQYFPAVETRNGQMLQLMNERAESLARRWRKIELGGSDAHAQASAGTTWTEVFGARTKEEFFARLREGRGRTVGENGGYAKLTRDVFLIARDAVREKRWPALLAPLALAIPAVTLANYGRELWFGRRWAARICNPERARRQPLWISVAPPMLGGEG